MLSDLFETIALIEKEEIDKPETEKTEIDLNHVSEDQIAVCESEDEDQQALTEFSYGDLYVVGKAWVEVLKTALVGSKFSLIPTVSAAPPLPPQKPPPMKYTDLPLYKSPHYEYKDYIEDKKKCPKAKVRIMHSYLYPTVKKYRREYQKAQCQAQCTLWNTYCGLSNSITETKRDIKKKMRDPNNLQMRQGVVLGGGIAGFLLGSGGGIPRRIFFTGLGLLSTGALCFPKETDQAFREFAYHTGKAFIALYNNLLYKSPGFRERIPCKQEIPPPPPPRKPHCPQKK